MVISHFLRWIDTARVADRAAGAAALARAYVGSGLAFEDRCAAEAALTYLLDDPSAKVRYALAEALAMPGVRVHLYGKSPRPGRKMGHVGAVADTASDAVERVKEARARLTAPAPAHQPAAAPRP